MWLIPGGHSPGIRTGHIFEEFRQGSEGFTRQFEGTGLGLTICRKFTTMLNGEISVSSRPGKGSNFTLLIPLYNATPMNNQIKVRLRKTGVAIIIFPFYIKKS